MLPRVHLIAPRLKRWLIGTLHYRVDRAQMSYYLDESAFRFNRRTACSRGLLFYRLLQQAVNTDPHPLSTPVRPRCQVDCSQLCSSNWRCAIPARYFCTGTPAPSTRWSGCPRAWNVPVEPFFHG